MANNIANKLIVTAKTQAEIEDFLRAIEGEENNTKLHIDFERIIPMPEVLQDTKCDSEHHNALYYYLMTTEKEGMVSKMLSHSQFYTMEKYKDKTAEELAHYKELGEELFKINLKYGACNWYDWRIYNWNTKWNAYDTYIESCGDGCVELYFYTAWSSPQPILMKLAEMFPHLTFDYKYADEDMTYNCGEGYGEDGEMSFRFAEGGSDDAMEIYVECWQEDWSNFKKTENGWEYDWGDDEEENE